MRSEMMRDSIETCAEESRGEQSGVARFVRAFSLID
jgi:hypothetical protein